MAGSLLVCRFPAGVRPLDTARYTAELVIVLALRAAEVEDGTVFLHEHLAGAGLELASTETADMLFYHLLPPRKFLCLTLGFKKHDDISFTDRAYRVAGNDPSFVAAVKDAAFYLHCLSMHTG
jgi:hypothetical protein